MHLKRSVTNAIIAANTIVFLVEIPFFYETLYYLGLIPGFVFYRPRTIFTYAFVHANFLHLFFNMYFLRVLGNALERRIGRKAFALLYFSSVILVGLIHVLLCRTILRSYLYVVSIGASGAVMAVLGAAVVYMGNNVLRVVLFPIPIPLKVTIRNLALIILIIETSMSLLNIEPGIAHDAHIAGLIIGYLIARNSQTRPSRGVVLKFVKKRPKRMRSLEIYDPEKIECVRELTEMLKRLRRGDLEPAKFFFSLRRCSYRASNLLAEVLELEESLSETELAGIIAVALLDILIEARNEGEIEIYRVRRCS